MIQLIGRRPLNYFLCFSMKIYNETYLFVYIITFTTSTSGRDLIHYEVAIRSWPKYPKCPNRYLRDVQMYDRINV